MPSQFSLLLARAHRRSRYPGRVRTSRSAAAGRQRGGLQTGTLPLRGVGEARAGILRATETEPRQADPPPRPAGGFKNGPPDDTSCLEPTAGASRRDASFKTLGAGEEAGPGVPQARTCRRRCRSSRGSRPSAFGGERAVAAAQRRASAGALAHRSTATPGFAIPGSGRPPPTPGPARRGPPHPSRPSRRSFLRQPSSSLRPPRLPRPSSGHRPPGRAAPHTGAKPHLHPGSPRPAASSGPCNPRGPQPSPHPWARPSHSGPGTLALHRLSHSLGRLVWVPREGGCSHCHARPLPPPPRPGRSYRGGARDAARAQCGARPGRTAAGARRSLRLRRSPAGSQILMSTLGFFEPAVYPESILHCGAILRWAPGAALPRPKDHRLRLYRWPKPSGRGPRGRRAFAPCPRGASSPGEVKGSLVFSLPNSLTLFLESRREGTSLGRPRFESHSRNFFTSSGL